jgi:hypothetical protein
MTSEKRYFSVAEANATIPDLEAIFGRVMRVRAQLKPLYQRLDARGFAPTTDDFDPVAPGATADVVRERVTFKGLLEVLKQEIEAVQRLGCMVKDLDVGLVDWWARSGLDDVLLCWRFGEKQVSFFHDTEQGFAGRRPISELRPPRFPPTRTLH